MEAHQYTYEAAAAKQTLIDTYGWTITDGGQAVSPEFVISVKTDNVGVSDDNQFELAVGNGYTTYDYNIETSDGQVLNNNTGNTRITFPSAGTYQLKITGVLPSLYFQGTTDKLKVTSIINWGTNPWLSLNRSFIDFRNCVINATDLPNLSQCTSLKLAFYRWESLVNWDVTNLDVSNVTNFEGVFQNCSNLETLEGINNWQIGDLGIDGFKYAFDNCRKLTSTMEDWDVTNIRNILNMFSNAYLYDNTFGKWNITGDLLSSNRLGSLNAKYLSTPNYDDTLIKWENQLQIAFPNGVGYINTQSINFGNAQYSYEGASARQTLIDTYGWTITDGGQAASPEFVIQVKTDNTGTSADNEFTLPWIGTYDIDWGDGVVETGLVDTQTHTYASAGTYDVKVTAATGRIRFRYSSDLLKLLNIKNWGTCAWTNMDSAFWGCKGLTIVSATDYPVFNGNVSLHHMFRECENMTYIDVSNWQMNGISSIYTLFFICYDLQTIKGLENWDVSSVTNMRNAFGYCGALLKLDVDVWDINQVGDFRDFASSANLPLSNYNKILISWASQSPQINQSISFGNSQYSYEAAAARQTLIDTYGWTITDGGQVASPEFAIQVKTDNTGTSNDDQFTLSWIGVYDVDWGDGVIETGLANTQTHTYVSVGTYNVKVTAASGRIKFRSNNDGNKLIAVKNWGTCVWTSFQETFFNCHSLTELPSGDSPNLSGATSFSNAFYNTYRIENWGTISNWDFSNVTSIATMFYEASTQASSIYNIDISNWNFGSIDLRVMYNFNKNANTFSDIGSPNNWNTSGVIICPNFNGNTKIDVSAWNFSSWDVTSFTTANIFSSPSLQLSFDNYDATLISWAAQNVNNNVTANFGGSKYSLGAAAEAARNTLINTYGWTITDGGGVYKPVSGLLFDYPSPTSAYSLRALASFQGGISPVVVRVRRSSDNVEQDFTSTEITDGTLISFTGANDGFVVKIYDQSYYLEDIYQNTATRQAKIVNAGSLILEGGLPCIQPAGGYKTVGGENLNYYTNEDTFTYHLQKPDGAVVANNEFFIDSAGGAEYGREGFSFGNNYARINYPYGSAISSISYSRDLTDDIYQPLVWESYPSSLTLNDRLKLYNQDGLLADGNTSNTTPTGQGSTRVASFFASEGGTFRTLEGNWQETILYKEENIPNRDNFLTSISEYYNFPATSGLLFDYPGASAAYSLRNLANNVTSVVRVRRSSDNTEQDFTAVEITDGTLTTFTGANDGFVTVWYDQSGNSKHATQSTALYQRILVTNGVLNTYNGKPCDDYVAGSRAYNVPNDAYSAPFTYFMVAKPNVSNSDVYQGSGNNGTSILYNNYTRFYGGNFVDITHTFGLDQIVTYALFNGASSEFQVNDITPITTGDIGTTTNVQANKFGFAGYHNTGGQVFEGKFQEMIIYTSDKSTYREGVIANINTEYTIYEPATSELLVDYPNASAAYSLRNLINTTTNVVRVRRSNDNTEQDFTATDITDGTLATFCSGTDGFVAIWYDQSGSSNNAVQPAALEQPKIVENGVVLLSNNKPSLRFREGSTKRYLNQPLYDELNSSFSVLSVVQADGNGSQYEGLLATNTMMKLARVNNGNWGTYPGGVAGTNLYTNTTNLITMISSDGNTGDFYTNNTSDGSFTSTDGQTRQSIGGGQVNQEFNGFISEMIIYPTDQSANRTGIETNINTEYTIY